MRHAWLACVFVAACTSSGSSGPPGDPQTGDATASYSSKTDMLVTGSAVVDSNNASNKTTNMLIQLGTDHVTCDTNLNQFPKSHGTYAYASVNMSAPGAVNDAPIGTYVITASNFDGDFSTSGGVVNVTTIDTRITGTMNFTLTSTHLGAIVISGNFDVEKCF